VSHDWLDGGAEVEIFELQKLKPVSCLGFPLVRSRGLTEPAMAAF
jgi:hypothetical protein